MPSAPSRLPSPLSADAGALAGLRGRGGRADAAAEMSVMLCRRHPRSRVRRWEGEVAEGRSMSRSAGEKQPRGDGRDWYERRPPGKEGLLKLWLSGSAVEL
jgi:hypothetical protein